MPCRFLYQLRKKEAVRKGYCGACRAFCGGCRRKGAFLYVPSVQARCRNRYHKRNGARCTGRLSCRCGFHACIEYAVRSGYVDAVADVCNGASWLFRRYHLLEKAQHARPLYLLLPVSPRYLRRNNEYIKCAYLHDRYKLTDNYRIYHLRHTL